MNGYGFEKYINCQSLNNTFKYIVKSGDSLYSIAKAYNTTIDKLMTINNLATTMIYPNQILFVPIEVNRTKEGETVRDLLKERGIDTNLEESILSMKLLPNQEYVSPSNTYVIEPSDNLDIILRKTGLSVYELIRLNQGKWLKAGEKIIIK